MKVFIYPYKMGSESAKELAKELGVKLIKHVNSKFKPGPNKTVINWGSPRLPVHICNFNVLNQPMAVNRAINKLDTFRALAEAKVSIPPFTTDKQVVQEWLNIGKVVFARKTLNGHAGAGIVVLYPNPGEAIPDAPLFTQYILKQKEYRVHIYNGEVIDLQQKVRNAEENDGNFMIRNHENGFVFARNVNDVPVQVNCPEAVLTQAKEAIRALGLDFGGVDVIYSALKQMAYVLEVNTAPGIEGQTVQSYAKAIKEHLKL